MDGRSLEKQLSKDIDAKEMHGTISFCSKNVLSAFVFLQGFSNAGVFSIYGFLVVVKRL